MPVKNKSTITRVYNAPVKTVWDAWTDPAKAAQWWGPRLHYHNPQQGSQSRWTLAIHNARS